MFVLVAGTTRGPSGLTGRDCISEITRVETPRRVLKGSSLVVDVVVTQTGYSRARVPVVVEETGRIVDTQEITLPPDGEAATIQVRFKTADPGARIYRIRIPPQDLVKGGLTSVGKAEYAHRGDRLRRAHGRKQDRSQQQTCHQIHAVFLPGFGRRGGIIAPSRLVASGASTLPTAPDTHAGMALHLEHQCWDGPAAVYTCGQRPPSTSPANPPPAARQR